MAEMNLTTQQRIEIKAYASKILREMSNLIFNIK